MDDVVQSRGEMLSCSCIGKRLEPADEHRAKEWPGERNERNGVT
jgi:hypothetical protein